MTSTLAVIALILGGGSTYTWVLHFGRYFSHKDGGQLVYGSTYMRVYMVVGMVLADGSIIS